MTVTVYHNPRCSKSRETIQLLTSQQIEFDTRLYLQDIPNVDELKNLVKLLGFQSAKELMRQKESIYKILELADVFDDTTLLNTMHENPKLIERPIVVIDNQAAQIGRPPEAVMSLFKENT